MTPRCCVLVACILWRAAGGTATSSYDSIFKRFDVVPLNVTSETQKFDPEVMSSDITKCQFPSNCRDIQNCNHAKSGSYRIFPLGFGQGFWVYCDMVTDGGGWLVFQRRQDGSVDFYRGWQSYKDGFGNLYGEFWLGLDKIHLLTKLEEYELLIILGSYAGEIGHAKYKTFRVADEGQLYRLRVASYTGTIGDGMAYQNGRNFSTFNRDNDNQERQNCAKLYHGAWWYNACLHTNLNGWYLHQGESRGGRPEASLVAWHKWKGKFEALQFSEMKIRPPNK